MLFFNDSPKVQDNSNPVSAGLKAWYDFSSLTYLDATANAINFAIDRSGNGNNTQTQTLTARPVYTINQQNGLPTAVFAGAQFLALPSALYSIPNAANTVFITSKRNVDAVLQIVFNMAGGNATEQAFFYNSAGTIVGTNDKTNINIISKTGVTTTNYNIYCLTFNGTSAAGGVALTNNNGTASTGAGSVCNDITGATIGCRGSLSFPLVGGVAEILIYNALLSTVQINQTQAYLKTKWGTP